MTSFSVMLRDHYDADNDGVVDESGASPLSDDSPQALGTAGAGTGSSAARSDHVHAMPNRARGAYNAIVYIQDGDVIAEDGTGAEIDSGTAGTDDATVVQSAVDSIGYGTIDFARPADLTTCYHITSKITGNAGIYLNGNGSYLDVTTLNDFVFELGSDEVYNPYAPAKTGASGFFVVGDATNNTTGFLKVVNSSRNLSISDIFLDKVNYGVLLRGVSIDALIFGLKSARSEYGNFIEFQTFKHGSDSYRAVNATVLACECTGMQGAEPNGVIVYADPSSITTKIPQRISVRGCWFEQVDYGVYTEGYESQISDCRISAKTSAIAIKSKIIGGTCHENSGNYNQVVSNPFLQSYGVGGSAVLLDTVYKRSSVLGNNIIGGGTNLETVAGYGVRTIGTYPEDVIIRNNFMTFLAQHINGKFEYSEIDYNQLMESSSYVNKGLCLSGSTSIFVRGNTLFNFMKYGSYDVCEGPGAVVSNATFEGNIFSSANVSVGSGCTFKRNSGYITENSGSSTGTGSEHTIAHGLVAAPSKVAIVPTETGATVSAVWADATNIYATVTTGKAFNWSAEV